MKSGKYRFVFYVHDGAGLGHLTRITRVAEKLESELVECLIVSGFREMSFIVPSKIKYCKLPSRETMIEERAQYWGKRAFIDIDIPEVYQWRKRDMEYIFNEYKPDAFFIDYYPTGKRGELKQIISGHTETAFYYIHRGIIGCDWSIKTQVLTEENVYYLENYFEKLFLMNDREIFDFSKEYHLPRKVKEKCIIAGYTKKTIPAAFKRKIRKMRGLKPGEVWAVCTAGGGKLGEKFTEEVSCLPDLFPQVKFDIVLGPRSSLEELKQGADNCCLHKTFEKLPELIAAADICITTGGYNTIVEALSNNTYLIISPSQLEPEDEQYFHALKLKEKLGYDPLVRDEKDYSVKIRSFLDTNTEVDYSNIDMNGLEVIKQCIYDKFKIGVL